MTSEKKARGTFPYYGASLLSLATSANTSWRFFGERMGIHNTWERTLMFSVVEFGFIASAYAMRYNMRRDGKPGFARTIVWILSVAAGYMAFDLSGLTQGIARIILGPVLGLIFLHAALGIELRTHHENAERSMWQRIVAEYRERFMSRIGLGDETRSALTRTRDRNALKVAQLAVKPGRWWTRSGRLARALAKSNVANDPDRMEMLVNQLAVLKHAENLGGLKMASPWPVQAKTSGGSKPPKTQTGPIDIIRPDIQRKLSASTTHAERVRFASEHLKSTDPKEIAQWLHPYGYQINRSTVHSALNGKTRK